MVMGLPSMFAASSAYAVAASTSCSIGRSVSNGQVVSLSDGEYDRCMSVITPSVSSPVPVLFNFHGGGGNGADCGAGPESSELASLAEANGFALICGEALQNVFGRGGQWNVPEIITDSTGTPCEESDSHDIGYMRAAVAWLEQRSSVYDTSRLFFTGCSMGSAFTGYISSCWKQAHPEVISAFATHSTGLKVKGDGLRLPPDNYDTQYTWGECPNCQYFPFKPEAYGDNLGLKACVFDNTGDGDFYETSVNLGETWGKLGNKVETHFDSGGHCQIHSHAEIVNCMDDGTGRLLANGPAPTPSPTPSPSPSPGGEPSQVCQACLMQRCGGTPKQTPICEGCAHETEGQCGSACGSYGFDAAIEWFCNRPSANATMV